MSWSVENAMMRRAWSEVRMYTREIMADNARAIAVMLVAPDSARCAEILRHVAKNLVTVTAATNALKQLRWKRKAARASRRLRRD